MSKTTLKRSENDSYSNDKLARIKRMVSQELTFKTYCKLSNWGLSDLEIKRMYALSTTNFQFFKNNHKTVLGKLREWY